MNARFNEIGPGYFGKLGVPLIAGREFTEATRWARPQWPSSTNSS